MLLTEYKEQYKMRLLNVLDMYATHSGSVGYKISTFTTK